ncbi:MAG: glycoside hydrolase family 2 TIM barrel-domain containing protein [Verrucomicrobiota bacterium]
MTKSHGFESNWEGLGPRLSPLPMTVDSVAVPCISLAGDWRFNPAPQTGFEKYDAIQTEKWANIRVPGEWVMQGFEVKKDSAAAYWREFEIPDDWHERRIKLRCDGVYSDATVWVNGREAGRHIGGFTPFELDVTDSVKCGRKNIITLAVKNESLADSLASGTQYACHPLGGITRKIQLLALPPVNLSRLHIQTTFDKDFRDATLAVELAAANEGAGNISGLQASLALTAPDGRNIPLSPNRVSLNRLTNQVSMPVIQPLKWDNEHPNLYTLTVKLELAGQTLEVVSQKIGFRQVEVRGNQLFLNNVPVKFHGVCRHETHPLLGRSLPPEWERRDVEIFRDGNCNFIRTSHYPPAEEFTEACDELGMLVEVEAPFCWADRTHLTGSQIDDFVTRQELEMLEFYRNHPSVTHWSLGNESENAWTNYFLPAAKRFKQLDPSRPINYSSIHFGKDGGFCDIGNHHYPGLGGPEKYAANPRPVTFDEYCHLNSYNRRELTTDPGLRDFWGQGLEVMWQKMRQARGCLGGAIWAAIDDTFFLPNGDTVGYGTWGPIDGWRRPKPEFWNMKKVYSPLQLHEDGVPANQSVKLTIENRHDFTDLSELTFEWKLGERSGTVKTSAGPGHASILEIPVTGDGQLLEIRALSPRGFVEDFWRIALGADPRNALPKPSGKPGPVVLEKTDGAIIVHGPGYSATINAKTGFFASPFVGPELLVLAKNADNCGGVQMAGKEREVPIFSDTCNGWKASSIKTETTPSGAVIRVEGSYAQARGIYNYCFNSDGSIVVRYTFTVTEQGQCNPRQIGVVFKLPAECDTLIWRRKSHWSYYPEDHIGRAEGTAKTFVKGVPLSGLAGARTEPKWSWSADGNQYGANDFRSTKLNFIEAALLSPAGHGLRLLGDGSQHLRSWVSIENVNLLAAQYANEGAAPFFSEHVVPDRPLKAGDLLEGEVRMEIR